MLENSSDVHNDIPLYVNRRLREHRLRLGYSLTFAAKSIGISLDQLDHYESGGETIPLDILYKLADAYKVSPSYFLGGFLPDKVLF